MKRIIIALALILGTLATEAQTRQTASPDNLSALMPMPNRVEQQKGRPFRLIEGRTAISYAGDSLEFVAHTLAGIIERRTGVRVSSEAQGKRAAITLSIDSSLPGDEHYRIEVTHRSIALSGSTAAALFRGAMTIDQLLMGDIVATARNEVSPIVIDDAPRFGHRAIMLDPARHFLPVKDIKFFIDQMARFKFNVLQLHLTDDQGWRIEIKSHPELTERGAFRKPGASDQGPDNGYYTQDDIREIIAYAAERNIEVIPELDIPGHSVAILSAHPQLGCSFRHNEKKELGTTTNMMLCAANEEVYSIYKDIIAEVAGLFPSDRIHLGGDEAAVKENWAKCPHCIAMMQKLGYENPSQLMIPFFNMVLDFVRSNGKKAILWCELDNMWPPANDYLFPYPKDVTLVTWRNALTPKCVELTRINGHELIMAPGEHAYLDYPQYPGDLPEFNNWGMPITTLEQSYRLDPGLGLQPEEQAHITGVMATLWGEAIRDINRVTYMAFPRAMAIAEAGWSQMEQRAWKSFRQRIYPNITEMMKNGVSVRVPFEIVERK